MKTPTGAEGKEVAPFFLEIVRPMHIVTHRAEEMYSTIVEGDSGYTKQKPQLSSKKFYKSSFNKTSKIPYLLADLSVPTKSDVDVIVGRRLPK